MASQRKELARIKDDPELYGIYNAVLNDQSAIPQQTVTLSAWMKFGSYEREYNSKGFTGRTRPAAW